MNTKVGYIIQLTYVVATLNMTIFTIYIYFDMFDIYTKFMENPNLFLECKPEVG